MTAIRPLDPIRRRMLEDMGIDVWFLGEPAQVPAPPAPTSAGTETVDQVASSRTAGPAAPISTADGSTRVPPAAAEHGGRRPPAVQAETAGPPIAVTCLVSRQAVLLADNAEPGVSSRLCRDLLAALTGDWAAAPRVVKFSWDEGGRTQAEGWRAFKAFADMQVSESDVAVVLCSARLAQQLPDVGAGRKLLALPHLNDLGADGKRELWRRLQQLGR